MRYEIKEQLGDGAFGIVYRAQTRREEGAQEVEEVRVCDPVSAVLVYARWRGASKEEAFCDSANKGNASPFSRPRKSYVTTGTNST